MQPGVTVVLATVWLAVAVDVGVGVAGEAATGHPATHLTFDQYSPPSPHRRRVYGGTDIAEDWKNRDRDIDQPLGLSIGPRRSILDDGPRKQPFLVDFEGDRILPKEQEVSAFRDIILPTEYNKQLEIPKTIIRKSEIVQKSSDPRSSFMDDSFVADDTFQDQGPGSVEIYKLDLFKEKTLLSPTPSAKPPIRGKSKAPKKTGRSNWKTKTPEYKSTSPKSHYKQSNFFEERRTEIPHSRDSFDVGGVPELQVGCEGLEASSHKLKRSVDTSVTEEYVGDIAGTWLHVTPATIDLNHDLSYDESYEEIDELIKLKQMEEDAKNKPKRGDIDAKLLDNFFSPLKTIDALPVRGDLGDSFVANKSSDVLRTFGYDQREPQQKRSVGNAEEKEEKIEHFSESDSVTEDKGTKEDASGSSSITAEKSTSGSSSISGEESISGSFSITGKDTSVSSSVSMSDEEAEKDKSSDIKYGRVLGRKLLWLKDYGAEKVAEHSFQRSKRSALWGFGENEGAVSSDELQSEERRRQREEERRRMEYERRRQENARRNYPQENHSGQSNGEIDRIREEYEELLRQKEREDEERRRRVQQVDPEKSILSRWEEEERRQREYLRRQEEIRRIAGQHYRNGTEEEETLKRQREDTWRRNQDRWQDENRRRQEEERRQQELEEQRRRMHQPSHRPSEEERRRYDEELRRKGQYRYEEEEARRRSDPRLSNRIDDEEDRRKTHEDQVRRRQEEERRRQEEERRRQAQDEEERRRQMEEMRRQQEARINERRNEDSRGQTTDKDRQRYLSPEDRRSLEERQREWSLKRRQEEERRRQEEERRRQEVERQRSEEQRRRPEEQRQQQEEERRKQEEERRRQEIERRRPEEERRRQEEERRRQEIERRRPEEERRRQEEEERRRQEEERRRQEEERRRPDEERRRQEEERRRQEEERRRHDRNQNEPPSNLMRPNSRYPYQNSLRERQEHDQKLRDYIQRNQPINVDRTRYEEARRPPQNTTIVRDLDEEYRRREEEHRRRLEHERRLQEYIRRNQPVVVNGTYPERNLYEERRIIEAARQYDRSRYPSHSTDRRQHGPSAPTNIDPRSYLEARRREEARRLEEERRREEIRRLEEEKRRSLERQRQEIDERRKEAARREEEARRQQSRRYEEERKKQEAARSEYERRRQELIDEQNRRAQAGRTRMPEVQRPGYDDRRRVEEQRRRHDSLVPANFVRDDRRRAMEERRRQDEERRKQEEERRRYEAETAARNNERRRQEEDRLRELKRKEEYVRDMTDNRRRFKQTRLNSLPVSARIIIRPGESSPSTSPVVLSRAGFANEINFADINPNRAGILVSKFPAAPTVRPPAQSPGPCVWAVVQCCSNLNRLVTCFESMGCPGISFDPNPCRGSVAEAARQEVMKFYAQAERDNDSLY